MLDADYPNQCMDRDENTACSLESALGVPENRSKIMVMILAMVRDFEVAEDLFQETVLEILQSREHYDKERAFVPWACGIARHVVLQHWERRNRQPVLAPREAIERLAEVAVDTDSVLWRDERSALQKCLEGLPGPQKQLFILRYGHDFKGQELAKRAGILPGSIRTTLARLRRNLRECIQRQIEQTHPSEGKP